jgi:hypothetical protein
MIYDNLSSVLETNVVVYDDVKKHSSYSGTFLSQSFTVRNPQLDYTVFGGEMSYFSKASELAPDGFDAEAVLQLNFDTGSCPSEIFTVDIFQFAPNFALGLDSAYGVCISYNGKSLSPDTSAHDAVVLTAAILGRNGNLPFLERVFEGYIRQFRIGDGLNLEEYKVSRV